MTGFFNYFDIKALNYMEYNIYDNSNELSLYILTSKDKVKEISSRLLVITGYDLTEFIGKSIDYVFKLIKLRKIEDHYIIVTKEFDVLEVYLNSDRNLYTFIKIQNVSIGEKFNNYENLHLNKGRGFAVYDASKLVLLKANNEYLNLLINQYGVEESYIGKSFYEISNNKLTYSRLLFFKKVIKTGNSLNIEIFKCETVLNKEILLEVTFIPIYENNKIKYIIESFTDVTERESQKKKVLLLEKQKEFFYFICHEFKMPLTVISSAIQMFKVTCLEEISPCSFKYVKKIKQASMQQLSLVNNLLEVLKSEEGQNKVYKKNLDLIRITKEIIDSVMVCATTKEIKIKFSSSIDEVIIGIDYEKYERILLNLISNALKFTDKLGCIYVNIDVVKNKVRIQVKDTGVGIAKEKQGIIFERFGQVNDTLTRENEGTGIGLYLVKQLITALDGTIDLTSKVGKGSCFSIFLPTEKASI